jgi:hypothetical protein
MSLSPISISALNDKKTRVPYAPVNAAGEPLAYLATRQEPSIDNGNLATVSIVNLSSSARGPVVVEIDPVSGALGEATITLTDEGGLPAAPLHVTFVSDLDPVGYTFLPSGITTVPKG